VHEHHIRKAEDTAGELRAARLKTVRDVVTAHRPYREAGGLDPHGLLALARMLRDTRNVVMGDAAADVHEPGATDAPVAEAVRRLAYHALRAIDSSP